MVWSINDDSEIFACWNPWSATEPDSSVRLGTVLTVNAALIQVEHRRQQRGSLQQQTRCITEHALDQLTGTLDGAHFSNNTAPTQIEWTHTLFSITTLHIYTYTVYYYTL